MKSFIVASLAMLVFLTVASAAPNQSPDNAQPAGQVCNIKDENGQDDVFAYSEVEPYLNQLAAAAFCPGDGLVFNGKKTCQVGCRAACLVPTCGGYKECEQIPNERLHKYRCHCNK